ncbi:hypothetical protein LWI28_014568 [Acer negundo]|uniref:Uncharacterized protein n=1 Tax=Acer negundo TaxID=4023 RepID=A0AAD5IDZ9_ACENE|nr:hypothetical protein LWI28_014568 [Acer negundo]KAK4838717.1 hypothetical protein QYF36_015869 [Acer negundo]
MENESAHVLHDKDGKSTRNGASESKRADIDVKDVSKPIPGSQRNNEQINVVDQKVREPVSQGAPLGDVYSSREVNMEATITTDDVIRAGGFGARDDISSFLPVASDSTDFEASIRDAQEYEQPREEVRRPGLGWTEASEPV